MEKVFHLGPNSTAVARSVLDPLAAILVPRFVDESNRFPARRPVRSLVCFLVSLFPVGLENTSMTRCGDCFLRQTTGATPSTRSGGGMEMCELVKDIADDMFDLVKVLVRISLGSNRTDDYNPSDMVSGGFN